MCKYYVRSGALQVVVMAETPQLAAGLAIKRLMDNEVVQDVTSEQFGDPAALEQVSIRILNVIAMLGMTTYVNERGFEVNPADTSAYPTITIIREIAALA